MSAARYEHTARSLPDVTAFFFMHGAVHPTKIDDSCYNYSLTGTKLPPRTQLYAPKILGKSYHATNIIDFVSRLKENWNEHQQHYVSFSKFCFSKIVDYERKQVDQMEQEIEDSDFFRFMESATTSEPRERKKRRLFLEGAIVQKSQIRWGEHECFISEKSYYVIRRDKTENCIMFFCDNIKREKPLQRHKITLSNGKEITVYVSYNRQTKLFKITFDRFTDYVFSFEELNQIVQFVVRSLNSIQDFNLALFDFTCCVTLFNNDECLRDLTPELLSSVTLSTPDDRLPKLIYGTVSEERRDELASALQRGMTANYDFDYFSQEESLSTSPSPSPSPARPSPHSPSPARPNPLLVVNLLKGVGSFADFEPISIFGSRPRSVSPNTRTTPPGPEEVDGGSRSRRSHRHRRVGNKVSRKQMTRRSHRRNRPTKVHSKRSKRQRGNTK